MALILYDWYDSICFIIIGAAFINALYMLLMNEGVGKRDVKSGIYESLSAGDTPDSIENSPVGHLSYSQLWRSCWRGLHPAWLLALRFTSFVVLCVCLMWDIKEWGLSIFFYYTEWTFTLVIIYFGIGTVISAHGCVLYNSKNASVHSRKGEDLLAKVDIEWNRIQHDETHGEEGSIKLQTQYDTDKAGFWGYLMQILYQTCAGAIILTDIVFWCIIVPFLSNAHLQVNLLMGSMHTLNAVFLLLDTSINNLPFPWFRLSYFVLWSCCYVIFQFIIHACGYTWWPYPFLELSTPWAPFWYFIMTLIHIPCYGIYSLFVKSKNSIFSRLFPHAYIKC